MADLSPSEQLAQYQEQLLQIDELLKSDPENEEFKKLKEDMTQLISITEELISSNPEALKLASLTAVTLDIHTNAIENDLGDLKDQDEGAEFDVGSRVEAFYALDGEWYPAIVKSVNAGVFTIIYIGYGNQESVPLSSLRPYFPISTVNAKKLNIGAECQAVSLHNGMYYDAVIDTIHDDATFTVLFTQSGTKERVPIDLIRLSDSGKKKKVDPIEMADFEIPEKLRILPGDSEEVIERKRKKVKALKQQMKIKTIDKDRNEKQIAWKQFKAKESRLVSKVKGAVSKRKRESMFKSPETVDGKVGVVGSGKSMTQFDQRKRHKGKSSQPIVL